jgi:hypothetical protein
MMLASWVRGERSLPEAVHPLDRALRGNVRNADGTVRDAGGVLDAPRDAGTALDKSTHESFVRNDLVVSLARDIPAATRRRCRAPRR